METNRNSEWSTNPAHHSKNKGKYFLIFFSQLIISRNEGICNALHSTYKEKNMAHPQKPQQNPQHPGQKQPSQQPGQKQPQQPGQKQSKR